MTSIIQRVREVLYEDSSKLEEGEVEETTESNEDLEGEGEFDDDVTDENDLDADSVCINLSEDGTCTTGAECGDIACGDTCPFLDEFSFTDCCNFTPISQANDDSSFADGA